MADTPLDLPAAFGRHCEPALRERLASAATPEEAARAVGDALAPLLDPAGETIGPLPRVHGERVRSLVGLIMECCDVARAGVRTDTGPRSPEGRPNDRWLVVAGGAAVSAAVATKALAWAFSPVVGIPAGLAAGYASARLSDRGAAAGQRRATRVEPDAVVTGLRRVMSQAQLLAERGLLSDGPEREPLDQEEALMELLQRLLSRGETAPLNAHGRKLVEGFLWRSGVSVHEFDPAADGPAPDPERWDVEPSETGDGPFTVAPALCLHAGGVVRRGRVQLNQVQGPASPRQS